METATWQRLAADLPPGDVAAFAAVVGRLIREFTGKQRVVTLARYALFVEAAVRPGLRPAIDAARARLAGLGEPLLATLGSTDPPAHFPMLLALIDGLLGIQLVSPDDDVDPEAAVAALLHGFRAGPSA